MTLNRKTEGLVILAIAAALALEFITVGPHGTGFGTNGVVIGVAAAVIFGVVGLLRYLGRSSK
jgi:hypothetical protein